MMYNVTVKCPDTLLAQLVYHLGQLGLVLQATPCEEKIPHKKSVSRARWTNSEISVLMSFLDDHTPIIDKKGEIMAMLPGRTWAAIDTKCWELSGGRSRK